MNAKVNVEVKEVEDNSPCVVDVLFQMQERLSSEEYMISTIRSSVIKLKEYGVNSNLLSDIMKELAILEQINFHNFDYVNDEIKKLPE